MSDSAARPTAGAVVALAGRRIDAVDARRAVFPLANVPLVRMRLVEAFDLLQPRRLVSSAACGADLLAVEVAEQRGVPCRIVLDVSPDEFRRHSVVDRPGDWEPVFDHAIRVAEDRGDLVILAGRITDRPALHLAVNEAILAEAIALAGAPADVTAIVVWDGIARERGDYTASFAAAARRRRLAVHEILTR